MLDFKLKYRLSDSTRCRRWQILSLERRKKILEFFQEEHFDSGKAQHPQIASERNSSRKQLLQRRVSARIPSVTDAIRSPTAIGFCPDSRDILEKNSAKVILPWGTF